MLRAQLYHSINNIQDKQLKEMFDTHLTQIVELLYKESFVFLQLQCIDGMKIETRVNKYSFCKKCRIEKSAHHSHIKHY